jgi:RNA polymerase sigma-70 factor (ECF subfamily)
MDLEALLEGCRKGDELAWEAFVRQMQGRVYALALSYAANREEARDLAQEVFVRLYAKCRRFPEAGRFLPWMICTARNVAIDYLRRRKARPPLADIPAEEARALVESGPDPEEACCVEADRRLLYRALQKLSTLNREIVVLREIQGLRLEEIASLLRVPVGTIKSRTFRARAELAEAVLALRGAWGKGPARG